MSDKAQAMIDELVAADGITRLICENEKGDFYAIIPDPNVSRLHWEAVYDVVCEVTPNSVINECGEVIDFRSAVVLMDDEICEELRNTEGIETDQDYFEIYCDLHYKKFDEVFEPNKANLVW